MHINEELLWDYADGLLSPSDHAQLETLLRTDPLWQDRLQEVLALRAQLHAMPLEKPRPGFADAVLAAWATERMEAYQPPPNRDWMVFGVAGAFTLFIFGALLTVIARMPIPDPADLPLQLPHLDVPQWDVSRWIPSDFSVHPILPMALVLITFLLLNQY
ncbi:MAG TPA: hypothetical protein PK858_10905, partial [Saprospiraceae bacterium]|nr:hypothetical protein [Saprospiraceae bacterium]